MKKQEFKKAVAGALKEYQLTRTKELRSQLSSTVEDYALNGITEAWYTTEVLKDSQNNIINIKEIEKRVTRPCKWSIERILGKDSEEITAIKKLVDEGYLKEEQLVAIEKILNDATQQVKRVIGGRISPEEID